MEFIKDNSKLVLLFKSDPENYKKEELGVKNNTLRWIEKEDPRLQAILDIKDYLEAGIIKGWMIELKKAGFDNPQIMISNARSNHFFVRDIKDVTFWKGWCIITWRN